MASLSGFRDTTTPSPFRFLYGTRNGKLLFPLDIAFTGFDPDMVDSTGAFLGASVSGVGFTFGTISKYNWPPLGAVTPVVEVTPDPGFPLTSATTLPPLPLPAAPVGSKVTVDINGSLVSGKVLALNSHAAYVDPTHQINAYIVQFETPLAQDHHGAAVLDAGGSVVGMLISTQPVSDAANALVCPV